MKRNIMRKNLRQTILKSLGRYIAIVAIIALGAGMFVGLLTTKSDMVATAQKFTDDMNMFHLRLLSTYGWSADDVKAVSKMNGVVDAEGSVSLDVIGHFEGSDEDSVYRFHTIPETITKVNLLGGRMPSAPDECLMDGFHVDDSVLGTTFTVSGGNEQDTLDSLSQRTLTVVGYVSTPLYMDLSRGSTSIGNGNLASYLYVPADTLSVDYFTEIAITIQTDHPIYSAELDQAMEEMADKLEPGITLLAQSRYSDLRLEAQSEYDKGVQEYEDGLAEYEEGLAEFEKSRQETLDTLEEALQELQDGQKEIDTNRQSLLDAENELLKGEEDWDEGVRLLNEGRQELAATIADTYAQFADTQAELEANEAEVSAALSEVDRGLVQLNSGIFQIETGLDELEDGLSQLETVISTYETALNYWEAIVDIMQGNPLFTKEVMEQVQAEIASTQAEYEGYVAQRNDLIAMRDQYTAQLDDLEDQLQDLIATKKELTTAAESIEQGFRELESAKQQAQMRFDSAEAELNAAQIQLDVAKGELDAGWAEVEAGKAALDEAQATLDEGWAEYESGKAEAEAEFAKAEAELADANAKLTDAKQQLDDAKSTIDSMDAPEVFLLDRNTNVGYLAVDSNSDIVAGVSRVFPAFFLLVAALVCITTMTRMIEEERTQIGILKALGYSNGAIINKYLVYTGSAAVLGCGLGVLIGSVVFPKILWSAYGIILNVGIDIVLRLNWPLCIVVVVTYTAVSMLVTWYCCRRSLREVPAELMRPKSPAAGKKILLEYLPFWNKISFLNKVMFRNVFRYRQRLLMMMVGIGGCTALLLTGFGIRDSIVGIVDHQFAEITTHDIEVYFSEDQTLEDQMAFREELLRDVDNILFFYQTTGDLEFEDKTKDITLICSDENITDFVQMYEDEQKLPMPQAGEACLTIGVAEAMGIKTGDTITVRDAQMRTLELKVTGIFVNYVSNFIITCPQTLNDQWGQVPGYQMAYISVRDNQDAHAAGAKISEMADVLNVAVSQDLADQVNSMLGALDLIVITIVVCAGLLAAIVLYNLTNISITERIREIATIKVLGFNAKESAQYVFKENLFLSAMGSVVGLFGGILLLKFVMSQIRIDMVWLTDRLSPWSFLWSVVLTMACACIVDFLLYFKLEKINMAEALKSVE